MMMASIRWLFWLYRGLKLSGLFPSGVCRYVPTCSFYAEEALNRYGICKGSLLALKRILRCHPGSPGGIDPLP